MFPIGNIIEYLGQGLHFAHEFRDSRILVQNGRFKVFDGGHVFANYEIDPRETTADEEAWAGLFEDVHINGEMLLHTGQKNRLPQSVLI